MLTFLAVVAQNSNAYTAVAAPDRSSGTSAFAYGSPSQAKADASALAECKKKLTSAKGAKCTIWHRAKAEGYGALSCDGVCSVVTGAVDVGEAASRAIHNCMEDANNSESGCLSDLHVWVDRNFSEPPKVATAKPKACSPPTGKTVRSTTQCDNGACVRTFENGCQVKFDAPYCLSPVTGKWDWQPDGC